MTWRVWIACGDATCPFAQESIAACTRMEASSECESGGFAASLLGHFSPADSNEAARDFWLAEKTPPPELCHAPPTRRAQILHEQGLTLLPPLAGSLPALESAPTRASVERAGGVGTLHELQPPRARTWRVVHSKAVLVREATNMESAPLDMKLSGSLVTVDVEAEGAVGGRWVPGAHTAAHIWALFSRWRLHVHVLQVGAPGGGI